jgi:hypothetical protein
MTGIQKNGPISPLFSFFNNLDHLNVDRFSKDVIEMISNFKINLSQPKWTDLCCQMSKRLNKMAENDYYEMSCKRKAEQI